MKRNFLSPESALLTTETAILDSVLYLNTSGMAAENLLGGQQPLSGISAF
jgi:hypothetical protein